MGFFSEVDVEVSEMIRNGANREQVKNAYPMLREDEVEQYFADDHDGDEDDGQPSEYEEWQDYMGGDDWDHGQCDSEY